LSPADWRAELAEGAQLVFALEAVTAPSVTRDARAHGALAYALDRPDLSDFAMPALARHGVLQIAIATDGAAPALARHVRDELTRLLAAAGPALDALPRSWRRARRAARRGAHGAALYALAQRLPPVGKIEIDTE